MISTDQVQELLHSRYPTVSIREIRPLAAGNDWETFKVEWTGLWATVVVRARVAVPGRPAPSVNRNTLFADVCPGGGTRALYRDYEGPIWWELYRYLDGNTAAAAGGWGYLPSLVAHLRRIHRADPPVCPTPYAGVEWTSAVSREFARAVGYLLEHGPYECIAPVTAAQHVLTHVYPPSSLEPNPCSILHGDLSPRNIIVGADSMDDGDSYGVVGLIDWDASRLGDYMWDLAQWATFYEDETARHREVMGLYHYEDAGREMGPVAWHRFHLYFALITVLKLEILARRGLPDLSRGIRRVRDAVTRLVEERV